MLLASNDPEGINAFFINKFPLYNKFRDSKMILILLQLMIPMIALLFIDGLTKGHFSFSNAKKVYATSGVIFLFFVILMLMPSLSGSFILKMNQNYLRMLFKINQMQKIILMV